eukprot:1074333-Rhodomonas_salina.1
MAQIGGGLDYWFIAEQVPIPVPFCARYNVFGTDIALCGTRNVYQAVRASTTPTIPLSCGS